MVGLDWVDEHVETLYKLSAGIGLMVLTGSYLGGIAKSVLGLVTMLALVVVGFSFEEMSLEACLRVVGTGVVAAAFAAGANLLSKPFPEPVSSGIRGAGFLLAVPLFLATLFALFLGLPVIAYREYVHGEPRQDREAEERSTETDRSVGSDRPAPITRRQDESHDRATSQGETER